jgi:hypothetical protein
MEPENQIPGPGRVSNLGEGLIPLADTSRP